MAATGEVVRVGLLALLLCTSVTLQGCGSSSSGDSSTTTTTTSTTSTSTTSTAYVEKGQCSDAQRKDRCAAGFCNASGCECMPNYIQQGANAECKPVKSQQVMTFYMYRAMNSSTYDVANDNLASLSGVMWYVHDEVVVQSCPRKNDITRIQRVKVTMRNSDAMFKVRNSLFGEYVNFANGQCSGGTCVKDLYQKLGYVVGCEWPSDGKNYSWNGFVPIWYSLPGGCPEKTEAQKDPVCISEHPGGQCTSGVPDGSTCTFTLEDAGSVNITEFYGPDFNYEAFCKAGGREYDAGKDQGTGGVSFWDDRRSVVANARRVQALRALFAARTEGNRELPEPWCDWQDPQGPTAEAVPINV